MSPNCISSSLLIISSLLLIAHGLPATNRHRCPVSLAPPTNARGVNRLDRSSDRPLFKLHLSPYSSTNRSSHGAETYRVHMIVENSLMTFSSAEISISSTGQCGHGHLSFDPRYFQETSAGIPQCPQVIQTKQNTPMVELPLLLWTPPSCGCIHFRVQIIEGGTIYYIDDEDVLNGPLSQSACVQAMPNRENYVDALCAITDRYTTAEIMSHPSFMERHRLDTAWMDRYALEMALELRRTDNKLCCSKRTHKEKSNCLEDNRWRRIDKFCANGQPDIPFTESRLAYMKERERSCCLILGGLRYDCFSKNAAYSKNEEKSLLDFSKDETDPVNDLADFILSKDESVTQSLSTVVFGTEDDDSISGKITPNTLDTSTERDGGDSKVATSNENNKNKPKNAKSPATNFQSMSSKEEIQKDNHGAAKKALPDSDLTANSNNDNNEKDVTKKQKSHKRKEHKHHKHGKRQSGERKRKGSRRASGEFGDKSARRRLKESRRQMSIERLMGQSSQRQIYEPEPMWGGVSRRQQSRPSAASMLTSAEKLARARSSLQRKLVETTIDSHNLKDEEEAISVEATLGKLHKRMERLRIKSQCCEGGSITGSHVYGSFTHAWNECGHAAEKYVVRVGLMSGSKACWEQFRKCCLEQSVTGPTMTSREFRAEFLYPHSMDAADPVQELDRFPGDLEQSEMDYHQQHKQDVFDRGTPEAFPAEEEQTFKSMRMEPGPLEELQDTTDDGEEYDGPRRFDEADNDENDNDILHRSSTKAKKNRAQSRANEDVEDFDERAFGFSSEEDDLLENDVAEVDNNEMVGGENVGGHNTKTKGLMGALEDDERNHKKSKTHLRNKDKYRRRSHEVDIPRRADVGTSRQRYDEDLLLAVGPSYSRKQSGGRSRGRRFRSRSSKRRSSKRKHSKRSSRERSRRINAGMFSDRAPYYRTYGHPAALDSREMAFVNGRKITGTLDSREMAEEFGKYYKHVASSGRKKHKRSSRMRRQ